MKAFVAGKTPHVDGIRARGNTLSIRLTGVSGSFLSRLAMSFSCAVPIGTPVEPKGLPAIPTAGPYYVASYQPNRQLVLRRNPNYRGTRPHRLNELDLVLNVGEAQAVKDIEMGRADYAMAQPIPPSEHARLAARYGPTSPLGRAGKQQFFINSNVGLHFFALNADRPLFAGPRMRQAVNFAVDRRALVGPTGIPTDQYIPPVIAGFRDAHIYPLKGDLARARRLAGRTSRPAVLYTCDDALCLKKAQILVRNLEAIGIHVKVDTFPFDALQKKIFTKGEPWDIADTGIISDGYYDPFDFLNLLFDSTIPLNGNTAETFGENASRFDDPAYNRRLEAAARLTGSARYAAYARLDADLTRKAAPVVAFGNFLSVDFFSKRMGCQIYGPNGMDLAALCIRGNGRP